MQEDASLFAARCDSARWASETTTEQPKNQKHDETALPAQLHTFINKKDSGVKFLHGSICRCKFLTTGPFNMRHKRLINTKDGIIVSLVK